MTTNVETSAGLEEIKQMLLGMQLRNKEFWDKQVVQIRSLRHTFNQGAAKLSKLQTLMAEPTQEIKNPSSVETPHDKAKEDDYDIPAEKEAVHEVVKVVVELAAPIMVVFKVQLILQYNCSTVEKISEYVELHPPPLVHSLKTLGIHCMPSVCGNVTVKFQAYFVSSWRQRIDHNPLCKLSVQGLLVLAPKPPPLPPEITLPITNMVLGVPFSSVFKLQLLDNSAYQIVEFLIDKVDVFRTVAGSSKWAVKEVANFVKEDSSCSFILIHSLVDGLEVQFEVRVIESDDVVTDLAIQADLDPLTSLVIQTPSDL